MVMPLQLWLCSGWRRLEVLSDRKSLGRLWPCKAVVAPSKARAGDGSETWNWTRSSAYFADTFLLKKESALPTPKPPYAAAFRQQMVELVRAGRGITVAPQAVTRRCRWSSAKS